MRNKTAGISENLLRPDFPFMYQIILLLRRELLRLSVLRITLLRYLLILRLRYLLIAVRNRLIRHTVGLAVLRCDWPETLTDRDLLCRMSKPMRYHKDPERAEQDNQDPDDRGYP